MVEVNLKNIGRRFAIHWIFRKIDLQLKTNEHTVILGNNGSGKSTLLKIISGILSPSEGEVHYLVNNNKVDVDSIYKSLSLCTPYLSIPEEFTLDELLSFHQKLKPLNQTYTGESFAKYLQIEYEEDKAIHLFSSGMKQRVKLALALLSKAPLVLLDEPLNNLDEAGKNWYQTLVNENKENRLIVVCSNNTPEEFSFCNHEIRIGDYKS